MFRTDLNSAFEDCLRSIEIDGESVDDCLSRYPELAGSLRELLATLPTLQTIPPEPSAAAFEKGRQALLGELGSSVGSPFEGETAHDIGSGRAGSLRHIIRWAGGQGRILNRLVAGRYTIRWGGGHGGVLNHPMAARLAVSLATVMLTGFVGWAGASAASGDNPAATILDALLPETADDEGHENSESGLDTARDATASDAEEDDDAAPAEEGQQESQDGDAGGQQDGAAATDAGRALDWAKQNADENAQPGLTIAEEASATGQEASSAKGENGQAGRDIAEDAQNNGGPPDGIGGGPPDDIGGGPPDDIGGGPPDGIGGGPPDGVGGGGPPGGGPPGGIGGGPPGGGGGRP